MFDIKETLSGGFGAICCAYSGNPFDVIKIRLQTQINLYKGPIDCIKKIFIEERIFAFWKGVIPALGSSFIENSVLFTANGLIKRQYLKLRENKSDDLTSLEVAFLGGLSGICSATCITPAEVIKCRAQISHESTSLISILSNLIREDGLKGLFRGLSSTILRDVPFTFFFFGGYDISKYLLLLTKLPFLCSIKNTNNNSNDNNDNNKLITTSNVELNFIGTYLAGGFGGAFAWSVIFPIDSIKSRIQTNHNNSQVYDIFIEIYKQSGWKGFYRGWSAAVIRAFPANAGLILGYEMMYKFLNQLE